MWLKQAGKTDSVELSFPLTTTTAEQLEITCRAVYRPAYTPPEQLKYPELEYVDNVFVNGVETELGSMQPDIQDKIMDAAESLLMTMTLDPYLPPDKE